jgi:hypothetical protein
MQSNDQISEQPRLAVFIVKAEDLHIGVMSKIVNLYINALGGLEPVGLPSITRHPGLLKMRLVQTPRS